MVLGLEISLFMLRYMVSIFLFFLQDQLYRARGVGGGGGGFIKKTKSTGRGRR
jgi:hypothetical protein